MRPKNNAKICCFFSRFAQTKSQKHVLSSYRVGQKECLKMALYLKVRCSVQLIKLKKIRRYIFQLIFNIK